MTSPQGPDERGGRDFIGPPARDYLVLGAHWGLLAFFIGLGGYHLVAMLVALVVHGQYAGPTPLDLPELGPLVLVVFLPHVLLALGPLAGSRRWGRGIRLDLPLLPDLRDLRIGLACGAVAVVTGSVLNLVLMRIYGNERTSQNPLTELAEGLGDNVFWLVVLALLIVIAVPIAEELLVRGSLWSALEHYRLPRGAVLALTAIVFAYLHEDQMRTVALFGQGLAIGAARMITGRLASSVVAHSVNNLLPALVLVFA
ncbi:MAG: lysostaphin resistance A-like protein [Haloechinothrix sp.]